MENSYTLNDVELLGTMKANLLEALELTYTKTNGTALYHALENNDADEYLKLVFLTHCTPKKFKDRLYEFFFYTPIEEVPLFVGELKDLSFLIDWRLKIGEKTKRK